MITSKGCEEAPIPIVIDSEGREGSESGMNQSLS